MSLPAPYYSADGVVLYNADCREILPEIDSCGALCLTDPPYGVSERTDRKSKGRANAAECYDFPPVYDDDKPFNPAHLLLAFDRLVLWGANYYAERLPASPSWLTWDKRDGISANDNADVELAWTNLGGPARIFRHRWSGMIKASEKDARRVHPTQKPVALMEWIISTWTQPGALVVDPYAGSGPALVAAKQLGRRALGVEISRDYCDIIVERLRQRELFGSAP